MGACFRIPKANGLVVAGGQQQFALGGEAYAGNWLLVAGEALDFLALLETQGQRSTECCSLWLWVAAILEDLSASGFVRPHANAYICFKNPRFHLLSPGRAMALRLASAPACQWPTQSSHVEFGG